MKISHFIDSFHTDDAPLKSFALHTLFELSLCLTRAQYQNRFRIANKRYHLIIIYVEMTHKSSILQVL